jgi:hypothetical protein
MILCLAKVLRSKELGQAHNLCALSCRVTNKFNRADPIFLRVCAAAHLD